MAVAPDASRETPPADQLLRHTSRQTGRHVAQLMQGARKWRGNGKQRGATVGIVPHPLDPTML
eukprot:5203855-Pleurochrysis_carterae.AAC.4